MAEPQPQPQPQRPSLETTASPTAPFPYGEDPFSHNHHTLMTTNSSFRYKCVLEISLPTAGHAETIMKALEVDREIGDRVTKSFSFKPGTNTGDLVVLRV